MFRKLTRPELLTLAILIAVTGITAWPTAEAQFGEGNFGGLGFGEEGGQIPGLPEGAIRSQDLTIVVSKSQQTVSGYSQTSEFGEWDKVQVAAHPEFNVTPIVTSSVAVVPGKGQVYAFSARTGRWATLEVEEDVDTSQVAVAQDYASLYAEPNLHMFSNASGKWASVDLTQD